MREVSPAMFERIGSTGETSRRDEIARDEVGRGGRDERSTRRISRVNLTWKHAAETKGRLPADWLADWLEVWKASRKWRIELTGISEANAG